MYYVMQALEQCFIHLETINFARLFWFALLIVRFHYIAANYLPVHNRGNYIHKRKQIEFNFMMLFLLLICSFILSAHYYTSVGAFMYSL